ncbi:MAG: hypothetical protein ACRDJE_01495 [Dehalococcoidia bacterium]
MPFETVLTAAEYAALRAALLLAQVAARERLRRAESLLEAASGAGERSAMVAALDALPDQGWPIPRTDTVAVRLDDGALDACEEALLAAAAMLSLHAATGRFGRRSPPETEILLRVAFPEAERDILYADMLADRLRLIDLRLRLGRQRTL